MEDIYYFAIIFAMLMLYFGINFLCWRYNPIWLNAQLRMLSVGQVRRNLLSSQKKDGCIIYVVKAINKKTIVSDTYILKGGKYVRAMVEIGRFKAWTQPVWVLDVKPQYE